MRPALAALAVVLLAISLAAVPARARDLVQLGAAINDDGFQGADARYRATLAGYDAVVAESAFKIGETEPQQGVFTFPLQDQMVSFAAGNGQQVHGHTLLWCDDQWLPAWLTDRAWTAAELTPVVDTYITTVMQHFGAAVSSWDVVNEALDADGTQRDCLWSRVLGPGWVEHAFRVAHEAVPGAKLFYNEYRADWVNTKFAAMEDIARDFLARGVPLDGIGLQLHLFGRAPPQYRIEEAMARIAALGLRVRVSELDDTTSQFPGTTAQKLDAQAQAYQTVAAACQAQPACDRLTTWGFTDAYSVRGPGEMALPFDTGYQPKPAWAALQRVLRTPSGLGDRPPDAPGAPTASALSRGQFSVSWPAASDPDGDTLTYTLQHRDADDAVWSTIASGIRTLSYAFSATWPEPQGTWTYRVLASDASMDGPPSPSSAPAVVDRTAPRPPLVTADRAAEAADGDWFADSVTLGFASAGDPPLPDGSPGSGVDPASLPAAGGVFTTPGPHAVSGTVSDLAGNASDPGTRTVQVDTGAPVATLGATAGGQPYVAGTWTSRSVTLHLACADDGSGVGSADDDQVVDGDGAGQRRTATCRDRVGHSALASFGPIAVDHTPPTAPAQTVAAVAGEPITLRAGASDPPGGSGLAPDATTWGRPGSPPRHGPSATYTFPTPGTRSIALRLHDVAGNEGAAVVTVVVGPAEGTTLRSGAVTVTVPRRVAGRVIALRVRSSAARTVRVRLERRGGRRTLTTLRAAIGAGAVRTLRLQLPAGTRPRAYVVRVSVLRGRRPVGHLVSAGVVVH